MGFDGGIQVMLGNRYSVNSSHCIIMRASFISFPTFASGQWAWFSVPLSHADFRQANAAAPYDYRFPSTFLIAAFSNVGTANVIKVDAVRIVNGTARPDLLAPQTYSVREDYERGEGDNHSANTVRAPESGVPPVVKSDRTANPFISVYNNNVTAVTLFIIFAVVFALAAAVAICWPVIQKLLFKNSNKPVSKEDKGE